MKRIVFNYSELHFSEVTSYKIPTLVFPLSNGKVKRVLFLLVEENRDVSDSCYIVREDLFIEMLQPR